MMIRKVVTTVVLVVLGASASARQQQGSAPAQPVGSAQVPDATAQVKVSVGDTAAPPEWELSIPVALDFAHGTEAGRVSIVLHYPANALTYSQVKSTERLRDAGYDVKPGKPTITGDKATISLEFVPSAATASKPLPSGTIAILVFKVGKDAPEKTWPITVENIQARGPAPKAATLTAASGRAATFIVTPPGLPILSCFFYMH